MQALIWLIMLVLAAIGVASVLDYTGVYDVPMIDVVEQMEDAGEVLSSSE